MLTCLLIFYTLKTPLNFAKNQCIGVLLRYVCFHPREAVPMNDKIYLTIRMNRELHDKFRSVAAYEGRSMSRQILYLMNQCVVDFEKKNGPIDPLEDDGL